MVKCYCVYEAVNRRRREAVVGVTEYCEVAALKQEHARLPPAWIAGWDPQDAVEYRIVRRELGIKDAFRAAAEHSKSKELSRLAVHLVG